jgi:CubicO group peptidase (beta-lactamase class C family)
MESEQRRKWLLGAGGAAAALAAAGLSWHLLRPSPAKPAAGPGAKPVLPSDKEIAALEGIATRVQKQFSVPGLAVAIARHGQLVYEGSFGYANETHFERVKPASLFRIASVSKSITAVAIFTLIDQGKLALSDTVFGEGGRLDLEPFRGVAAGFKAITVHHLLTHMSGGWGPANGDPMFEAPELNHTDLIARTLATYPLTTPPGSVFRYSNFNYCLLGRIIERVSGQPYADYVRQQVLSRCGVSGMLIAGNHAADRAAGEVTYYANNDENPYGLNIARLDSHGGWIASAADLVRFAMHVDGFKTTPSILSDQAIKAMTQPVAGSGDYACGWAVNAAPNWWHNGSLPGTSALLVRTASGLCWAALANVRNPGIDGAIDEMMWQMARAVPAWKA